MCDDCSMVVQTFCSQECFEKSLCLCRKMVGITNSDYPYYADEHLVLDTHSPCRVRCENCMPKEVISVQDLKLLESELHGLEHLPRYVFQDSNYAGNSKSLTPDQCIEMIKKADLGTFSDAKFDPSECHHCKDLFYCEDCDQTFCGEDCHAEHECN